jgi:hypothetical protein
VKFEKIGVPPHLYKKYLSKLGFDLADTVQIRQRFLPEIEFLAFYFRIQHFIPKSSILARR